MDVLWGVLNGQQAGRHRAANDEISSFTSMDAVVRKGAGKNPCVVVSSWLFV